MKEECTGILRNLTGKRFIVFVRRGNTAIRLALRLAKKLGYKDVLLQDQGGWLTYTQFCKKEKLEFIELKTDYGLLEPKALKDYSDCALLVNSMPAYAALQDMKMLEKKCDEKRIFLINDITGSIGTPEAEVGSLILGSFGEDKPVNLGTGGFLATNNPDHFEFFEKSNTRHEIDFEELLKKLNNLNKRLNHYRKIRSRIIDDLRDYHLIHRESQGINVIVKYYSEIEKERLINYCDNEKLEYTLCPRSIRVKAKAVCIEVKRK